LEDQSTPPHEIRYEASASFLRLLQTAGCSLALSVYMSNRVILLSVKDSAKSTPAASVGPWGWQQK
jgi:hypothetical protein